MPYIDVRFLVPLEEVQRDSNIRRITKRLLLNRDPVRDIKALVSSVPKMEVSVAERSTST